MNLNKEFLNYYLILIWCTPFFIWSFLGGHKQILFGINTDHIATALACLASLLVLLVNFKMNKSIFNVIILYSGYLFLAFISIFYIDAPSDAVYIYITQFVYFFITIFLSVFFSKNQDLFFKIITRAALLSAAIILLSFLLFGISSWGRMTIPVYIDGHFLYFPKGYSSSSDPNVLAYFLSIGFLSSFFYKKNNKRWFISLLIIFSALLLTASRSALVALVMAILVYFLLTFNFKIKVKYLIGVIALAFPVTFSLLLYLYNEGLLRLKSAASDSDRMERLLHAKSLIFESIPTFVFGKGIGYSRAIIDPHNFYLSSVIDTGFISLILIFSTLIFVVVAIAKRYKEKHIFAYVVSLITFFMLISLFYWQVRTYYFIIMILLVVCCSSKPQKY